MPQMGKLPKPFLVRGFDLPLPFGYTEKRVKDSPIISKWQDWKDYAAYYRGLRGKLTLALILAITQAALLAPVALLTKKAFDQLMPQGQFASLLQISAVMLVLYLTSHSLSLYNRFLCLQITKRAVQGLRNDLIDKIYALSRHFFTKGDHSRIHSAIVYDTERVDVLTNAIISLFLPAAAIAIGLCAVLASLDPLLFLVALASVPPLFWLANRLSRKVQARVRIFHRDFEDFSSGIQFAIKRADLTRAQAAEESEIQRQKGIVDKLRRTSGTMAWMMSAFSSIQNSLVAMIGILILVAGAWQVIHGRATTGDLLSFYVALALLREQVRILADSVPSMISGSESLQKLFAMLRLEDASPYRGEKPIAFHGGLRASDVHFSYDEKQVLRGVDLEIESGKVYVLAGSSGAGKSTLLKLLLGFYRPFQGGLWAEGVPFDEIDFKQLRRQIGIILQDPFLFKGSIAENLRYGSPEASDEDLRRAAALSTADEFIKDLPIGYETQVGEDGIQLSGGQCQRIAVARALLKNPSMLILDEPTTHLDPSLVQRLLANLRSLASQASILVVSHDARLFSIADKVLYLQDGQIREGVSAGENVTPLPGFRLA